MYSVDKRIFDTINNLYNMDNTSWREVLAEMYNNFGDMEKAFNEFEAKLGLALPDEVRKEVAKQIEEIQNDYNGKIDALKQEYNIKFSDMQQSIDNVQQDVISKDNVTNQKVDNMKVAYDKKFTDVINDIESKDTATNQLITNMKLAYDKKFTDIQADYTKKINDVITSIDGVKLYLIKSNVDYKGESHDTLDGRLQEDYAMIMDRFNKANLLPYEKEYITANNTYEGKTTDNVVKGRTLQNLCPPLDSIASNWVINNDGSIPIAYYTKFKINKIMFKPNTLYTAIFITPNDKVKGFSFFPWQDVYCEGKVSKFTTNDLTGNPTSIHVKGEKGTLLSIEDILGIKVILLEGDYTNNPIPPYFEGIKSVNEDGETLEEISCGKNLVNENLSITTISKGVSYHKLENGFEVESSSESIAYCNIGIDMIPKGILGKTVMCSCIIEQTSAGGAVQIFYRDENDKPVYVPFLSSGYKHTFPTKIKGNTLMLGIYANNTSTPNTVNKVKAYNILMEIVSDSQTKPSSYEPYQGHRLPIKMKNLRGLENICDTSDGFRRVEKIIIDGTQDIKLERINNNNIANFYVMLPRLCSTIAICDKLLIDKTLIANVNKEGFMLSSGTTLYIRLLSSKASTVEQAKLYFKNNPYTFYYGLITPTKEEGNTEELRTYDGTTNIFTEGSLIKPTISCKVPSNVQEVVMSLRAENNSLNNELDTLAINTREYTLANIETNVEQECRITMLEMGVI